MEIIVRIILLIQIIFLFDYFLMSEAGHVNAYIQPISSQTSTLFITPAKLENTMKKSEKNKDGCNTYQYYF